MAIGFKPDDNEVEEEYVPLYRTIIECTVCGDKDLFNIQEGYCSCENLHISVQETISKVMFTSKFKEFKTVTYDKEEPKIYEVLIIDEVP
jgi:hypothetical protein